MCQYFTTIRLYNPRKYTKGSFFDVYLTGVYMGEFVIEDTKRLTIETMNEWIAKIDTGYTLEETRTIIRTMNKTVDNFTDQSSLSYILLKRIDKK
jgi:hypothetical protein